MRILQAAAQRAADLLGHESRIIRAGLPFYEGALWWLSGRRGVKWSVNGVPCRIHPHYRNHFAPNWEPHVADFLRDRIPDGAVCVDVGANVGVYVIQLAHWSAPSGRIIAFEPNPTARAALEQHVALNHLASRVEIVPLGVGAEAGTAELFASQADGMGRLHSPNPSMPGEPDRHEVRLTTLDAYCGEHEVRPDLLLIDVEGYEFAALAGAQDTVRTCGRDLQILVEMHPAAWSIADTTREAAEQLLRDLGRRPVPLAGQRDPLAEWGVVFLEAV
jgi:FkbM family methyltransferase